MAENFKILVNNEVCQIKKQFDKIIRYKLLGVVVLPAIFHLKLVCPFKCAK